MIKITAKARLLGALFLLLSAAPLGGCSGTSVSSGEMEGFIPGKTTETEIVNKLGKPETNAFTGGLPGPRTMQNVGDHTRDLTSAGAKWGYIIQPKTLKELESSYLGEGEKLEQFVDLNKYLHKEYIYVGIAYTPIPLYTVSVFVFAPDGRLVQKNQIKYLKEPACDPNVEENCTNYLDPFWDFKISVEAVVDNYMTIYEEADVAGIKEELTRIKGPAKNTDAAKEQSGPAKQSPAKK